MTPMVVLQEITKRFGDFVAVDRISLEVARGEIFGFLGPNGAGKSTTIRMLCGLLSPSSGKGWVNGLDLYTGSEEIKASLGYMSQRFSLYGELRVEENLRFFAGVYGLSGPRASRRIEELLQVLGLSGRRSTLSRELPTGLKQRLALGCALLHRPAIVFLDEPTSGVDPGTRRAFWDLIYGITQEGTTAFVTTHYMEEAEYCNRIGLIDQGRLIALGTPEELKERHLGGRLYEVTSNRPLEALEKMAEAPGVLDAALFGRLLHVRLQHGLEPQTHLSELLHGSGILITSVRPIRPTLEDVFVGLMGKGKETVP